MLAAAYPQPTSCSLLHVQQDKPENDKVVNAGGAAGIAIGCFFGGAIITAVIVYIVNAKRNAKWSAFSSSSGN